MKTPLSGTD